MKISQETQWIVPQGCSLIWEQFDNGCLIFNPLSGTTHLLFDPALEILKLLQQKPMTPKTVIQSLELALESEEQNREIVANVWKIFVDLDRLGIIQPLPLKTTEIGQSATS
ncbi:MAG: HPr-rel-A system PqqD family peptide chaperone [Magnetococcales bacterium]|nr:HPr-rel-A system PqqD family peptide chaperone [Magnetococcales bacterium]